MRNPWRTVAGPILLALGYGGLSRLGMVFVDTNTGVAALWPASGLALGVFLLNDRKRWPALAAAVLVGNMVSQALARGSLTLAAVLGLVDAAEPILAALVIATVTRRDYLGSDRMRRVLALLSAAAVANALTAIAGGAAIAIATGSSFGGAWLSWYLADGLGILIVAPLITSGVGAGPSRRGRACVECSILLAVTTMVSCLVLLGDPQTGWPLFNYSFAIGPLMLWAAMRAGDRTLAGVLAVIGVVGAWGTAHHRGVFVRHDAAASQAVLVFQLFLIAMAAMGLIIQASVEERRVSQQRLRDERERLASVLRAATDNPIIATDLNGLITLFNPGAERMLGYDAADVLGRWDLTRFHTAAELEHRAAELGVKAGFAVFEHGTGNGRSDTREWTYVRRDGRQVPVQLTVTATRDQDGAPSGYIAIATNISERKRAERQLFDSLDAERAMVTRLEELDQAKSDFVATVSHELRTPLTSILGFVELLSDEIAPGWSADQRRMLELVERNTTRLQILVEDLLAIAKIDSETDQPDLGPVDLAELTSAALATIEPLADAKLISLDSQVAANLPTIRADAALVERVLLNLLSNAVKFTPTGGDVGVNVRCGPGRMVEVAVWDTGIGISETDQARMFERFFRTSAARRVAAQGTGLGLAIAADIVERHHGSIAVESGEGLGSTFTMTLPVDGPIRGELVTAGAPARPSALPDPSEPV